MALIKRRLSVPLSLQLTLLAALFFGSLAALVYDVFTARAAPELERAARNRLREASSAMAAAAGTLVDHRPDVSTVDEWHRHSRRFGQITEQVLSKQPGVEGGFYLNGALDRFAGYAFPTDRPKRKQHPDKSDPPPLEEPYIRIQVRDSLTLPSGEVSVSIRDVGPSRVMIVTEPVGTVRPAAAATWVMYRLVDPRLLDRQVRRYQTSTALALAGLLLALGLTARLGINLKREQREQTRLRDELRRSERLASLGKLLAGVAHEIRNPLAAIRSTVQLWQRMPERATTPESLVAVVHAVDRLNDTVTQLLQFSRADGTAHVSIDVNALLRETLELFAVQAAQQGVEIDAHLSANLPDIAGSDAALRQVFANLITNALDAMPAGGRLEVTTRSEPTGGDAVIDFADTGDGIAADIAPRLFEPFFTTRPQGTGLGLAICREIVIQHSGTIELVPGTEKGARFRITLPTDS
ncbi:MAG TPA: ATP-binding protein [Pirellulales bacterium]|nr:ATP-binding protein [Pirellulales bacterium]